MPLIALTGIPTTGWGVLGLLVVFVGGLISWLVKASFNGQANVTNRYFGALEEDRRKAESEQQILVQTIQGFNSSMHSVAQSMSENAQAITTMAAAHSSALDNHTKALENLTRVVEGQQKQNEVEK